MRRKMEFLIAYDIADEKRLKNVAKYLEKHTLRVQMSLYFVYCDKEFLQTLIEELTKMIELDEDDLRIYSINMKKSLLFQKSQSVKDLII